MKLKPAVKQACKACGKESQDRASVSIRVTDPWRRYTGSGRAIVHTANTKLCKKCYNKFSTELEKLIVKY